MSILIPRITGENVTAGAVTVVVAQLSLPTDFFGRIAIDLFGEQSGNPIAVFQWTNEYLVSQEVGVVTIRSSGMVPSILDPGANAFTVTVDTDGADKIRVSVLGKAGQNWIWTAHIGGFASVPFLPTDIAGLQAWYEADFTAGQGTVIDATGEPQLYTTIPNRGGLGGTFTSAGATRPIVGSLECNGSLRRSVASKGTTYHASSLTATNWKFLSDGTGCSIVLGVIPQSFGADNYFFITMPDSTSNIGIMLYCGAAGASGLYVYNGGTGTLSSISFGTLVLNQLNLIIIEHGTGRTGTNCATRLNGIDKATANYAYAPSSSDPTITLRFGGNAGNGWTGDICFCAVYNTYLSTNATARNQLEAYVWNKYNLTSKAMIKAPTMNFDPALGVTASAGAVSRIVDLSGRAHDSYQATGSHQMTISLSSATLGGKQTLISTGTPQGYAFSAGIGWPADKGHTTIQVLNNSTKVSTATALVTVEAALQVYIATPIFNNGANVVERMGGYDGASRPVARAALNPAVITYQVDTANTLTMYVDGKLAGTGALTAAAWSATGSLANDPGFVSASLQEMGQTWEKTATSGVGLFGTDLWELWEELAAKYGRPWHTTLIPGAVSILDPGIDDRIITAGGSVSRVNSDHAIIDVIADGSCNATGILAWTAIASATITKDATTPFEGAYCLNVAYNGSANPYARQTVMTIGQTYRLKCQAWGDASNGIPKILDGVVTLFTGVNTAAWQAVDVIFVATTTNIDFGSALAGAGFTRFDTISLENVTAGAAIQATGANQPTHDTVNNLFTYDGTKTFIVGPVLPSAACMYGGWVQLAALPASEKVVLGGTDGTLTDKITIDNTGLIKYYHGSVAAGSIVGFTTGVWHYLVNGGDSTIQRFRYDDNVQMKANATTSCTKTINYGANNNNGTIDGYMAQKHGTMKIYNRIPSVREVERIITQQSLANGYGYTVPTAYTANDWTSTLSASVDGSITSAGGAVTAWTDVLGRANQGATSPGAASTYPGHSSLDNSIYSSDGARYMRWIAAPASGTIETWFYMPSVPVGAYVLCGAYDGTTNFIEVYVATGGIPSLFTGPATQVASQVTMPVGWNYIAVTWNGAVGTIFVNGVTAVGSAGAVPATAMNILNRNNNGTPDLFSITGTRISSISMKNSALSVAQLMQNYLQSYRA